MCKNFDFFFFFLITKRFLEDYHSKSEHVIEEDVFRSLLDGISKHSKVIEINFEDFYLIFKNFLNQEYYKTFENESTSLNIQHIQSRADTLSKEELIEQ